jgi:methanethiol S-methyltransferase
MALLIVGGQLMAAILAPKAFLDGFHRFRIRSSYLDQRLLKQHPWLGYPGHLPMGKDPFLLSGLIMMCSLPL